MKYPHTAKLIKSARTKAGLTQKDMAKLLGNVTNQFICNIEKGKLLLPPKYGIKIKGIISRGDFLMARAKDAMKQACEEYDNG